MKLTVEQAEAQLSQVRQLVQHPGWPLICDRFNKGLVHLKESVFDMKLDDETASRIRHAAGAVEAFSPATLAKELEIKLAAIVRKAADETT